METVFNLFCGANHAALAESPEAFASVLHAALATLANGADDIGEHDRERLVNDIVGYLTRDMFAHADDSNRSTNVVVNGRGLSLSW